MMQGDGVEVIYEAVDSAGDMVRLQTDSDHVTHPPVDNESIHTGEVA